MIKNIFLPFVAALVMSFTTSVTVSAEETTTAAKATETTVATETTEKAAFES